MKTKFLAVGSMVLLVFSLFGGCSTSDRSTDDQGSQQITDDIAKISDIVEGEDDNITLPDNEDAQIDNNSSAEVEISADNAYRLDLSLSQQKYLSNSFGEIHYDIKNIYTGQTANASAIGDITLVTDGDYAKFIKFDGQEGNQIVLSGDNFTSSADIALKTTGKSGTANITVTVSILLGSGETKPLTASIPLVVEKNKSSSMAIVPVGTRYENDLFIDRFVIHVVDQYGNKAKDGTRVNVGVINNPKLYTNASNGNPNTDKAAITTDKDFTLLANDISKIDEKDNVVILANEDKNDPSILGGWSIVEGSIDTNTDTLKLFDDYTGVDESGLSFAIGNDRRYNSCYETLANAAMFTPNGTEVKDGVVEVELRYVPYMVGKAVFVHANSKLDDEKIGISRRVDLTGLGIEPVTLTCTHSSRSALPEACSQGLYMNLQGADVGAKYINMGSPLCVSGCGNSWGATATDLTCSSWTTASFTVDVNKTATYSFGDFIRTEEVQNR